MFHIKICGITNIEDALTAAQAGADAVGLNFYPPSPRYVSFQVAQAISHALPKGIARIGVFVNSTPADICRLFDETPLDAIQLHGNEPPEYILQLGNCPVIKTFHLKTGSIDPIVAFLELCKNSCISPCMVMLDSQSAGQFGGTGKTCDWSAAKQYTVEIQSPPLILAGGLNSENVAEAIRTVHPAAVDVASGVESSPDRKDPALVAAFIRAARDAFRT